MLRVLHDLPLFPWNHQTRYWQEPRRNRALKQRMSPPPQLIGSWEPLSPPFASIWAHLLRISAVPWVRDHVGSNILLPGAAYINMAIEGISQAQSTSKNHIVGYNLCDIEFCAGTRTAS